METREQVGNLDKNLVRLRLLFFFFVGLHDILRCVDVLVLVLVVARERESEDARVGFVVLDKKRSEFENSKTLFWPLNFDSTLQSFFYQGGTFYPTILPAHFLGRRKKMFFHGCGERWGIASRQQFPYHHWTKP